MTTSSGSVSPTKACALLYARLGLHVLGLHAVTDGGCACGKITCRTPGKHPRYDLSPRGSREPFASPDTVARWREPFNIGVVLGRIETSRGGRFVYVFDVDDQEIAARLRVGGIERLTAVATTGRGIHVWMASTCETPCFVVKTATGEKVGEFRGDGQYVVVPPSTHVSGRQYEWLGPLTDGRVMPRIRIVDDPASYVAHLLAGAGTEMAASRAPASETRAPRPTGRQLQAAHDGDELAEITTLPTDLAPRLFEERVLLSGQLDMTSEHDRSGRLWSHAHHICAAAEMVGRPIEADEVAGLLKGIDRASYRKYSDGRSLRAADHEYHQIARKVLAMRRGQLSGVPGCVQPGKEASDAC